MSTTNQLQLRMFQELDYNYIVKSFLNNYKKDPVGKHYDSNILVLMLDKLLMQNVIYVAYTDISSVIKGWVLVTKDVEYIYHVGNKETFEFFKTHLNLVFKNSPIHSKYTNFTAGV